MQHLTPVGLSQDGKDLVLVSDAGEEFAVVADHRLRTALRGDQARSGQLEVKMEIALTPREIQTRIRTGESPEDVAAAAQTTVEAIMSYAAPVLAERAYVAQTAVKSSIRRATTESTPVGRTLDEASRQHFTVVSVRADDVDWDAWRREDGRWHVVATYEARGEIHLAEFTYDQPGRYVVADNDEARLLTGEAILAGEPEPTGRRLSAVPSSHDELPLGDDAIELVREHDEERARERAYEAANPATEPTEPVTEIRRPAATEQAAIDDLAADHADADWIATVPAQPESRASEQPVPDEPDEADAPVAEQPEPAEDAPPRKKGRSSVPSWDEIMFGGGKND